METNIEALEQHLLYHKALAESPEEVARINGYLEMLKDSADGTKLSDPVDETVRGMFSLVLENGMDPWAIDLENFVSMYTEKVANNAFDMVVAGKLIYMAWRVLYMQAENSRERLEPPVEFDEDGEDFFTEEEDMNTVPVMEVNFSHAYSRKTTRSVTFMELMDAFDEAVEEEEIRAARAETLEKLRKERAASKPKFDNKAHEEDDETVVRRVYKTIIERSASGPITLNGLYNGSLKDSISYFVSVLHLVRYGLLEIEQESLPRGEVHISVIDPTAEVPVITEA